MESATLLEMYEILEEEVPVTRKNIHAFHGRMAQQAAGERDKADKAHASAYDKASKKYGRPNYHISGGVSPRFPEKVNNKLRNLSHAGTAADDASAKHYAKTGKRIPYHASPLHPAHDPTKPTVGKGYGSHVRKWPRGPVVKW